MNLTIPAVSLKNLLKAVAPAVAGRTPKPALSCVRLELEPLHGAFRISATDLELYASVTEQVDATVAENGACLVPCDKLSAIVAEATGDLTLKLADAQLSVTGADFAYKLHTHPVDDFPPMPAIAGEPVEIDGAELRKCIERTLYATAAEASRYAINGILLDGGAGAVATDGHRLAMHGKPDNGILLPIKTAKVLLRALGDEQVKMYQSANTVTFVLGPLQIASNLLEGNFPPFRDVIPKGVPAVEAIVKRDEFISCCHRAAIMTTQESAGVRYAFGDGKLTLSSRAAETGESTIKMDCYYKSEPMEIGFNPQYMIDAAKATDDVELTIGMWANNKACTMRGVDYVAVIMPVNMQ